jgi:hypothetical protein
MAHKCGLHWMQVAVFLQSLDGRYLIAGVHHSERQAAVDALSIDNHRTGTALPLVTPLLRTGQPEMLTQRIKQCDTCIEIESVASSIDRKRHALVMRRCGFARGLCWSRSHHQSRGASAFKKSPSRQPREKREYPVHDGPHD